MIREEESTWAHLKAKMNNQSLCRSVAPTVLKLDFRPSTDYDIPHVCPAKENDSALWKRKDQQTSLGCGYINSCTQIGLSWLRQVDSLR
jgi:hypothetical protein